MLLLPGHNPDPTILRDGADYYVVTSTFEYFPALAIYHSTDLAEWTLIGHALDRPSQLNMRTVESGGGIFAPSLRKSHGRFYIACTAMYRVPNMANFHKGVIGPRGFYVWTDDIRAGAWSDPVYLDQIGIDQDLFFDDDDKVYLSFATMLPRSLVGEGLGIGVYCVEIDLPTGKSKAVPTLIRRSQHGDKIAEGPHVFKRDGAYYLTTAEGGTERDHQQWIFRSTEGPLGPWHEPPQGVNPILHNASHPEVQQTGHLDFEQSDAGWRAVFLGTRGGRDGNGGWSQLGRESFIASVEWQGDWPVVNNRQPITVYGERRDLAGRESVVSSAFSPSNALPLGWYHLRTPMTKEWSLDERPGHLTLYGSPYTLDVDESPVALFRKQTAFDETWTCEVDFSPGDGEEAGVVVWWSRAAYASASIVGTAGRRELQVKWCEPEADDFTSTRHTVAPGPVVIQTRATPTGYSFSTRTASGEWTLVKSVSVRSIVRSRPTDSRNVGTHFGLFAQGNDSWPCLHPAHFKVLDWRSVHEEI